MNTFTLKSIHGELTWKNKPVFAQTKNGESLDITAGPESDWFHNPASSSVMNNAPVALFTPSG